MEEIIQQAYIQLFKIMSEALAEIKKAFEEAKEAGEVSQLDLSQVKFERFTPEICKLFDKEKGIEVLILSNCGLKTLEGFPTGNFQAIDLSRNELSDNSKIDVLLNYAGLTQVFLNTNNIKQMKTIMPLKKLQKLIEIDLSENPVSELEAYPGDVFENFPAIQYVDRKDKEGNVIDDEAEDEFVDDEDDEEDQYEEEDDDEEEYEDEEQFDEESEEKPKRGRKRK